MGSPPPGRPSPREATARLAAFRAELGAYAEGRSDAELQALLFQVEWLADFALEVTLRKRSEGRQTAASAAQPSKIGG